jgi:hypothetical protein
MFSAIEAGIQLVSLGLSNRDMVSGGFESDYELLEKYYSGQL